MVVMLVPSLLLGPLAVPGHAGSGGRQNILILPLPSSVGNAPYNLGGRIVQELQIAMVQRVGVQVSELQRNSSMLARAKEQLDESAKEQLMTSYDAAVNPKTEATARVDAAAFLVKTLGVDAVVYGMIDQYEFSTAPDPNQVLIHLTATSVAIDKDTTTSHFTPLVVLGKSRRLADGGGSQSQHDNDAIMNLAANLATMLTGDIVNDQPVKPGKAPKTPKPVKTQPVINNRPAQDDYNEAPVATEKTHNHTWLWIVSSLLVGGGLAYLATSSSGGSSVVQPTSVVGYAYPQIDRVELRITKPANLTGIQSFIINRATVGTASTRGSRITHRTVRQVVATVPLSQVIDENTLIGIIDGPNSTPPPVQGQLYSYSVTIVPSSGARTEVTIYNGGAPNDNIDATGPDVPVPVSQLTATNLSGSAIQLSWTYNAAAYGFLGGYLIQRRVVGGGWETLDPQITNPSIKTATVNVPTLNQNYEFRVIAFSTDGTYFDTTPQSGIVRISSTSMKPQALQGVTAVVMPDTSGAKFIRLQWNAPQDTFVAKYQIVRVGSRRSHRFDWTSAQFKLPFAPTGRSSGVRSRGRAVTTTDVQAGRDNTTTITINSPTQTTYDDHTVVDNMIYQYQLTAIAQDGESSDPVTTASLRVDFAPGNVTGLTSTSSSGAVQLQWSAPTKDADGVTAITDYATGHFQVLRSDTFAAGSTTVTQALLATKFTPLSPSVAWGSTQPGGTVTFTDPNPPVRKTVSYAVVTYDSGGQASLEKFPVTQLVAQPVVNKVTLAPAAFTAVVGGAPVQLSVTTTGSDGLLNTNTSLVCTTSGGFLSANADGSAAATSITVSTGTVGKALFYFVPTTTMNVTVTATVKGGTSFATATGTVRAPTPGAVNITLSNRTLTAVATSSEQNPSTDSWTEMAVQVNDPTGVPVPGATVTINSSDGTAAYNSGSGYTTFSAGALVGNTGANGKSFTVKLRAGVNAATVTLTAASGTVSGTQTFVVTGGAVSHLSIGFPNQSDPVTLSEPTTCTVTATDANGNAVSGQLITLTITQGTVVAVNPVTDASGVATFQIQPLAQNVSNVQLVARAGTVSSATKTISFSVVSNPLLITGTLLLAISAVQPYVWELHDGTGAKLANTAVSIQVSAGTIDLLDGTAAAATKATTTDTNGQVTFNYTAPATPISVTLKFLSGIDNSQIGALRTITVNGAALTNMKATAISGTEIDLKWDNVAGSSGYEVWRSTNGTDWGTTAYAVTAANGNTYNDTACAAGTRYYYKARATYPSGGYSLFSNVDSTFTFPGTPTWSANTDGKTPSISMDRDPFSSNVSKNALTPSVVLLRWATPAPSGVTFYDFQWRTAGSAWPADNSQIVSASVNAPYAFHDVSALGFSTRLEYRMRARNASGFSDWTADVDLKTIITGPETDKWTAATLTKSAFTDTSITLKWIDADGESGYEVWTSQDGAVWTQVPGAILGANITSYTVTGLSADTHHEYVVRSFISTPGYPNGYTGWTNLVDQNTNPALVTLNPATVISNTEIDLTWNDVVGAEAYDVQRVGPPGTTVTLTSVPTTILNGVVTYQDKNLAPNTLYTYSVRATNAGGGNQGTWSNQVSATTAPVAMLTVMVDGTNNASVATKNQLRRIYYSAMDVDQLADASQRRVKLVVTGYTGNAVNTPVAGGAKVRLTTDRGTFEANNTSQDVAADGSWIAGVLGSDGTMTVLFCGAKTNISTQYVPPVSAAVLGQPNLIVQSPADKNTATTTANQFTIADTTAYPLLIGPPQTITGTTNIADIVTTRGTKYGSGTAADQFFPQQFDKWPVIFSDETMRVTANVTDLAGQPVLADMPIWFAQGYNQFASAATAALNDTAGSANISGKYGKTSYDSTNNASTAIAGFQSNHSGLYEVQIFALIHNASKPTLDANNNIYQPSPTLDYNTQLLPGKPSYKGLFTLNKTYAATGKAGWTASVSAANQRINCNTTMASAVTLAAFDVDTKRVLPSVPFQITADVTSFDELHATLTGSTDIKLEQTNTTAIPLGQFLSFDQNSQATVLIRGNNRIGRAHLWLFNLPTVTGALATAVNTKTRNTKDAIYNAAVDVPLDVVLYGPPLSNVRFSTTATPSDISPYYNTGNLHIIAGTGETGNTLLISDYTFKVYLKDQYGNEYPSGYKLFLTEDTSNFAPFNNDPTNFKVYTMGQPVATYGAALPYYYNLNQAAEHKATNLKVVVDGEEVNAPVTGTYAERISQIMPLTATKPISATITDDSVSDTQSDPLVRPLHNAANNGVYNVPISASVFDFEGNPSIVGFNIYWGITQTDLVTTGGFSGNLHLTALAGNPAVDVGIGTSLFTSAAGLANQYSFDGTNYVSVSVGVNTGTTLSRVHIQPYYNGTALNDGFYLHVGIPTPSLVVKSISTTSVTMTVSPALIPNTLTYDTTTIEDTNKYFIFRTLTANAPNPFATNPDAIIDATGQLTAYDWTDNNNNNMTAGSVLYYWVYAVNDLSVGAPATYSATMNVPMKVITPTKLTAVAVNNTTVALSWIGVAGCNYIVQRAPHNTTNWINLALANPAATTLNDTTCQGDTWYDYRVLVVDPTPAPNGATSQYTDVVSALTYPDPGTWQDFAFTGSSLKLDWNLVTHCEGYNIMRSIDNGATYGFIQQNLPRTTLTTNDNPAPVQTILYRLDTFDATGITTGQVLCVPGPVTTFNANANGTSGQIVLTWALPTIPNGIANPMTNIYVYRDGDSTTGTLVQSLPANATTWTDTVANGSTHSYWVYVITGLGWTYPATASGTSKP